MRIAIYSALTLALPLAPALGAQADSAGTGQAGRLFASDEVIELTLEAPLEEVFKERGQESSYHPGVLSYGGDDGGVANMEVRVKTRGKFRLQRNNCAFPPLRVRFSKKQVENTVFEGQSRLKLVTHCQSRSDYEQQVLLEHLAYRIYNQLTDVSFRTRLARITYVDIEDPDDSLTKYAFFIEDEEMMAQRNGWSSLALVQVPPWDYDQEQLNLVELFQYMIGNTDFDAFQKSEDQESCCHNTKVIGDPAARIFPVPYDFDWSGLVNRRYARPDPSLPIRTVRERLFRGVCRGEAQLEVAFPLFNERREAIYAMFREQEDLEEKYVKDNLEYLDKFYEVINDRRKVDRELIDPCRRVGD